MQEVNGKARTTSTTKQSGQIDKSFAITKTVFLNKKVLPLTFEEIQTIDGVVLNAECLRCTDLSRLEVLNCEKGDYCPLYDERIIIRRDV